MRMRVVASHKGQVLADDHEAVGVICAAEHARPRAVGAAAADLHGTKIGPCQQLLMLLVHMLLPPIHRPNVQSVVVLLADTIPWWWSSI